MVTETVAKGTVVVMVATKLSVGAWEKDKGSDTNGAKEKPTGGADEASDEPGRGTDAQVKGVDDTNGTVVFTALVVTTFVIAAVVTARNEYRLHYDLLDSPTSTISRRLTPTPTLSSNEVQLSATSTVELPPDGKAYTTVVNGGGSPPAMAVVAEEDAS
ncbi:hypothetical protein MMC13_005991 [Lambiella insularis]|nr:hypothetical protein [Lambiella insularis]